MIQPCGVLVERLTASLVSRGAHEVGTSPSTKRMGQLVDVVLAVQPRVVGIGDQPLDRRTLDRLGRPAPCRARLGEVRLLRHFQYSCYQSTIPTGIVLTRQRQAATRV